ncbi:MAG: hypothetical protein RMM98_00885 [Acidobacteriota bacterium]|nr:hypothetical protein [Blastocatellia bacterium]MDW8238142.1 hypothetical protein [Acidobacteriota bacterium]
MDKHHIIVCPSCEKELVSATTCSCGARWVGPPIVAPMVQVPRLGYGLTATALIMLAIIIQLVITGRALYFTNQTWRWELFLTTSYLARFFLPVMLLAAYLAWKGLRLATTRPNEFGGRRLARAGLGLSLAACLINASIFAARIPDLLENRRIKQRMYTEAMMYKLTNAITLYRQQYGSYPTSLIDLQEMDPEIRIVLDYWENPLDYQPLSAVVASSAVPLPFDHYLLRSRGPDGIAGTADDIIMRDGVIVSVSELPTEAIPPAEPQR